MLEISDNPAPRPPPLRAPHRICILYVLYDRYGGGTHSADPTLAAMSPMSPGNGTSMSGGGASGGGGGVGAGGSARSRSGSLLRVCGSSMIRSVSSDEGEVVSVHHFNTELGSPLVYGTRKGRVRSWDLRAREVSSLSVLHRKRGAGEGGATRRADAPVIFRDERTTGSTSLSSPGQPHVYPRTVSDGSRFCYGYPKLRN